MVKFFKIIEKIVWIIAASKMLMVFQICTKTFVNR